MSEISILFYRVTLEHNSDKRKLITKSPNGKFFPT